LIGGKANAETKAVSNDGGPDMIRCRRANGGGWLPQKIDMYIHRAKQHREMTAGRVVSPLQIAL
jgi:hypothetical protein